ncbi:hypothetical protein [Allostreptomyces psammosilenae]|uniref:Uncharacterized protein n=1 Tax=Allostreptomyces psammosilenae TaxID=1892865 RepID=A0A852ZSG0_9ACTN|nr:hypothetical protein [Allostreptomyces psammosilenae]NYI05333.1 hypothetical protein [Allostreptomyces psammosilenae]
MAWLRRRKETTWSGMVFADDAALEDWKRRTAEAGLTFVGKKENAGNTYVTFTGTDAEKAKAFLREEPVPHDRYYVVVETPDGVWGTDSNSIYLEQLRPWQLRTRDADCDGELTTLIDGVHNLLLAQRGIIDNFVVGVSCGRCEREWIDGVRYGGETLVRCPGCQARNRVDSRNIRVT